MPIRMHSPEDFEATVECRKCVQKLTPLETQHAGYDCTSCQSYFCTGCFPSPPKLCPKCGSTALLDRKFIIY